MNFLQSETPREQSTNSSDPNVGRSKIQYPQGSGVLLHEMVNDAIETHTCADELVIADNAEVFNRGR
jgi:hypothetical protein